MDTVKDNRDILCIPMCGPIILCSDASDATGTIQKVTRLTRGGRSRSRAFTCLNEDEVSIVNNNLDESPTTPPRRRRAMTVSTPRLKTRTRAMTFGGRTPVTDSPVARRRKVSVRINVARRSTTKASGVSTKRKKPILPCDSVPEMEIDKISSQRKASIPASNGLRRPTRRCSEPFSPSGPGTGNKLRKLSTTAKPTGPGRRRVSTTAALQLQPSSSLKLRELAKDELLASLILPLEKDDTEDIIEEIDADESPSLQEYNEKRQLNELKRIKVTEEICGTERNYITCLETMDKIFRSPMLSGGYATEKDVRLLFPSCLKDIIECHRWFLKELENRTSNEKWDGSIGEVFTRMSDAQKDNLLGVYTNYVNAFPKAISTFSKCSRNSNKFRRFIEDCYCKTENLDLPSFLIAPVQRLPRYVLLLRQLSKYTEDNHPDFNAIKDAVKQMEELIGSLNSSIQSSMEAYSTRELGKKPSVRRQLSKRRKKAKSSDPSSKDSKSSNEKLCTVSPNTWNPSESDIDTRVRSYSNRDKSTLSATPDDILDMRRHSDASAFLKSDSEYLSKYQRSNSENGSSPRLFRRSFKLSLKKKEQTEYEEGSTVLLNNRVNDLTKDQEDNRRQSWKKSFTSALASYFTTREGSKKNVSGMRKCVSNTHLAGDSSRKDEKESSGVIRRKYGISHNRPISCHDITSFIENGSREALSADEANNNKKRRLSDASNNFSTSMRRNSLPRTPPYSESEDDNESIESGDSEGIQELDTSHRTRKETKLSEDIVTQDSQISGELTSIRNEEDKQLSHKSRKSRTRLSHNSFLRFLFLKNRKRNMSDSGINVNGSSKNLGNNETRRKSDFDNEMEKEKLRTSFHEEFLDAPICTNGNYHLAFKRQLSIQEESLGL